jgi:hypothetical protein
MQQHQESLAPRSVLPTGKNLGGQDLQRTDRARKSHIYIHYIPVLITEVEVNLNISKAQLSKVGEG